jgi:hypothetical protein
MDTPSFKKYVKDIVKKIREFLDTPFYLFQSKRNRLITAFLMSGFVWFFLFTFGAFEFDTFIFLYRLYYTGTYGLICLIILLIDFFILKDRIINKSSCKGAIYWGLWVMFWIGLSNYLLTTVWYQWEEFSFYNLIKNQLYTLSIGVIFTPFLVVVNHMVTLRKGMTELSQKFQEIDHIETNGKTDEIITIYSKYKEGKFNIDLNELLYIQSCDNYVDVCYAEDSRIEHKLVRNTISDVEQSLSHPSIVRCHRSFIVNTLQIASVQRNRTLLQLKLKSVNTEIPVSRKYKKSLLNSLNL